MNPKRTRSFWGWGYADETIPSEFLNHFKSLTQMALKVPALAELPEPQLSDLKLRPPRFVLPNDLKSFCSTEIFDRASHSYGKSYRDIVRGSRGQFNNPPDYVAFPKTENELERLLEFCAAHTIAVIPYGGGSSVVGGVEPTESAEYSGVISCDLRHFNQIISIDQMARTVRVQAGIFGPALEDGLRPAGFTLRHFPQSFEFSTVGGWIATRSGGHFATNYTHIDDFVQSVRMITPSGEWQTRALPGSGAGPDPNRLILGSEGVLGIITEATLRLQHIPKYRARVNVRFKDEASSIEAVRQISQSGLLPSNCRLISSVEALSMGIGSGADTILLLGFESHDHDQATKLERALEICRLHSGRCKDKHIKVQTPETSVSESKKAERWRNNFISAPYLRDRLVRCGVIMETFETAVTWDKFDRFHSKILAATQAAINETCGGGMVFWRFTHVYPDGPAPYYTVIAPGKRGREVEQWDAIKAAVSNAIIKNGGTITHHHAVGKDHQPWYAQQSGQLFTHILSEAKRTVDPNWILNPDVLIKTPHKN